MPADPIEVPLSKDKVALISPEDADRVLAFKWSYSGKGYAVRTIHYREDGVRRCKTVLLHRFIVNAPDGYDVDHEDGNGLNCQRYNLRLATRSQNNANAPQRTGEYKGVSWSKQYKKWRADIQVSGVKHALGVFDDIESAALAYDRAAFAAWPNHAWLNFPDNRIFYFRNLAFNRLSQSTN